MRKASACIGIAVVVIASSCVSSGPAGGKGSEPVALNGMVYDYESRPVADAEISVDGRLRARSDINGRFSLGRIPFGSYKVGFEKQGFERTCISVDYTDMMQIIYVKIFSEKQLLAASEKEVTKRSWNGALAFLDRIDAIGVQDPVARYLRAVICVRRGEAEEARRILESMLADDYDEPYIHLFLADLLQYSLADDKAAVAHLEKYLKSRYDPDGESRLERLKSGDPDK
jgi:hypothetical protein